MVGRMDEKGGRSVESVARTVIDTPSGARVPLAQIAEVRLDQGPNTINRENVQRRIVVQANVAGRDLGSGIGDIRRVVAERVPLPQGYWVQYGGQFESKERAARRIGLTSIAAAAVLLARAYL